MTRLRFLMLLAAAALAPGRPVLAEPVAPVDRAAPVAGASRDAGPATTDYVPTVLVTGASKGIGLEMVKQYAARGARVIATVRDPAGATELRGLAEANPRITIEQLDVTDYPRITELGARYAGTPIDLLINNAGISGGMPAQTFGKFDPAVFEEVLRVNTIAPLLIAEAFLPSVLASRDKRIVAVSSSEGSIGSVRSSRLYFMRASKAALNMEMINLAWQLKSKGVAVGLVNPGLVDTDFMKGVPKRMLRPPAVAVRDLLRVIDSLTVENTGAFLGYDGQPLPW